MLRMGRAKVPRSRPSPADEALDLPRSRAPGLFDGAGEDRHEQAWLARLPESSCGKAEPHEQHCYTFATGISLIGYRCPGVEREPEAPPAFVTPQQLKQVHDLWWDYWISDGDTHRTVHALFGAVLVLQTAVIVWLALKVLGTG